MFSIPSQQRTAPKELIQMAKGQANDILMNIRGIDYIMLCSTDLNWRPFIRRILITVPSLLLSAVPFWQWSVRS